MFREVRRNKKQILSKDLCEEILNEGKSGVLNLLGDNGYPYGVPMSYVFADNKLLFHCMPGGHKMDSMNKHEKVSFTVVETDQIVPEEFTTFFRSVIVFGKAREIVDLEEKRQVLMAFVEKYSADFKEKGAEEAEAKKKPVGIFVVDIDHISGKEAIEFAEERES